MHVCVLCHEEFLHHNFSTTPFGAVGECGGWLPLTGWRRIATQNSIINVPSIYDVWSPMSYGHAIGIYKHPMA
jgi:hypothetical protein